jgi:hypothetical protein
MFLKPKIVGAAARVSAAPAGFCWFKGIRRAGVVRG